MEANQVLKILKITRPTLTKYVKLGKIRVIEKHNGFYDYIKLIWNKNNSKTIINKNQKQPDYTTISNYK